MPYPEHIMHKVKSNSSNALSELLMEHNFIKNRDIVLFSFQPWDTEIGSNFKDMALELAKHNRVLFVNRAPDRASLWRNKYNPFKSRLASKNGIDELKEI